jgi:hypothetical protein
VEGVFTKLHGPDGGDFLSWVGRSGQGEIAKLAEPGGNLASISK